VQFIVAHHLPAEYFTPLLDYISQTKKVGCDFWSVLPFANAMSILGADGLAFY
jgi:hypothetical protein